MDGWVIAGTVAATPLLVKCFHGLCNGLGRRLPAFLSRNLIPAKVVYEGWPIAVQKRSWRGWWRGLGWIAIGALIYGEILWIIAAMGH